jgi:antitoxin component YwqK of YwqJK toxin-antitoxin module
VLHGESTYTFPYQDTIARVEEHEYGTLVRETFMYPTGNPEKEIIWKGKHLCSISTWYENGTPRSHEELDGQTLVDGRYLTRDNVMESEVKEMQGTRVRRDAYGQLLSRDEINNGLLTQRTTYHPNGTPQESIPYRQGKPHGLKRTFLASGEPHTIEQWMHGEQNGVTTFFSNGEKVSECEFVAGQREGIERKFEAGIQVVEEIAWHHDKRHGATRFFHPSGTHTDWYHDGKLVSKFVFDELSRRGHH